MKGGVSYLCFSLLSCVLTFQISRSSNPHLMNFIRRNNLSDVRDLLSLYEKKWVRVFFCVNWTDVPFMQKLVCHWVPLWSDIRESFLFQVAGHCIHSWQEQRDWHWIHNLAGSRWQRSPCEKLTHFLSCTPFQIHFPSTLQLMISKQHFMLL